MASIDKYHQLLMLETLEAEPEITQADLAVRVGIAVGTVNWYLKQWSQKGWLKVSQIGRWRWQYILTPQGIAERTRLAGKYLDASMKIYRRTREQARSILEEVLQAGYTQVTSSVAGDLADILSLTCLEMGLECLSESSGDIPNITLEGTRFVLHLPEPDADQ
ncbi:MAG TPA: winged helix-turn-helix transcriptional regulator [Anaerolineales bacterium]|nr:winged helix-turn-helix transcriptional regulator [Anaerolineales bacterium]